MQYWLKNRIRILFCLQILWFHIKHNFYHNIKARIATIDLRIAKRKQRKILAKNQSFMRIVQLNRMQWRKVFLFVWRIVSKNVVVRMFWKDENVMLYFLLTEKLGSQKRDFLRTKCLIFFNSKRNLFDRNIGNFLDSFDSLSNW